MRRYVQKRSAAGFTLLELLIVITIIGILLAFILSASYEGVRRAEERATQALITKLDAGMAERLDALLATRANPNAAHQFLAGVIASTLPVGAGMDTIPNTTVPWLPSGPRAQVIARYDQIRAEMPDVFILNRSAGAIDAHYPLNFAAIAYPGVAPGNIIGTAYEPYLLPLGVGMNLGPPNSFGDFAGLPSEADYTGIFGASFAAYGGFTKSLFEAALKANPTLTAPTPRFAGFDGVDNNNDGFIDDLAENDPTPGTPTVSAAMVALLGRHDHKTARAEALYALLTQGQGPFGSVFSPEDFRDTEVRDTDGDGLPEFVDAWGEPLQFYRWPIGYPSDTQRGLAPYVNALETRDKDSLDPGQTLLDPSWWGYGYNDYNNPGFVPKGTPPTDPHVPNLSAPALFFQHYFHSLSDSHTRIYAGMTPANYNSGLVHAWDRGVPSSSYLGRRAFQSRYLILSGGPDRLPGVPVMDDTYWAGMTEYLATASATDELSLPGVAMKTKAPDVSGLAIESQAAPYSTIRSNDNLEVTDSPLGISPTGSISAAIQQAGFDDVSNHNLKGNGGSGL